MQQLLIVEKESKMGRDLLFTRLNAEAVTKNAKTGGGGNDLVEHGEQVDEKEESISGWTRQKTRAKK